MVGLFFTVLFGLTGIYQLVAFDKLDVFLACESFAMLWYIMGYFYHRFNTLVGNIKNKGGNK